MILVITFSIHNSYGFFDNLYSQNNEYFLVGEWESVDGIITVDKVNEMINQLYDATDPSDQLIINYLHDIIYLTDEFGSVIGIDDIFQQYKVSEMSNTLGLIDRSINSFIVFDQLGDPVFPDNSTVLPFDIGLSSPLSPGESIHINQVILTTEVADIDPNSLALSISMSGVNDISDYSIEILLDKAPFPNSKPFEYSYSYKANPSLSVISSGTVASNKNNLSSNMANTEFFTEVNNGNIKTTYQHQYPVPTFTGAWSRFPTGPNVYLNTPDQFVVVKKTTTRTGMILSGSADGSKSQINVSFKARVSHDGGSLPIIPIVIVVSRGISDNGTTIDLQNMPLIEMKVYNGGV